MRRPSDLDRDLRRAEHVAGGLEGDGGVADPHRLAERRLLRRAGEVLAVAGRHDAERLARRQHRAVAGAGMVGMAVGDQRPLDRPRRVDVEAAGLRLEAGGGGAEEVFGAHGRKIGRRSPPASLSRAHPTAAA